MVSKGMRRYKQRTEKQAAFVGQWQPEDGQLDLAKLFGDRHNAPLRLEIGFGHGRFLSQLAEIHPDENFIGVEQNDLRVTKTAHKSAGLELDNIRLFTGEAHTFVRDALPEQSLDRAYVLFSDPWPKPKHRRRRLMNRAFILDMAWAIKPGGQLIIATDTHNYGLGVLSHASTLPGLFRNEYQPQGYRINILTRFPTVFEEHKKSEGCTIVYLKLTRSENAAPRRRSTPEYGPVKA